MSSANPSEHTKSKTYKTQLDEAARASSGSTDNDGSNKKVPALVEKGIEKVAEYVPAASKLIGTAGEDEKQGNANTDTSTRTRTATDSSEGMPKRPEHDENIAEFVREQYRSKHVGGY
ncbi:hypothetical protein GGS20DRAFT_143824 [Poronia punctata]|nr:hypothetical protein GGS20DRAFT_143824 [Poronia punctata]